MLFSIILTMIWQNMGIRGENHALGIHAFDFWIDQELDCEFNPGDWEIKSYKWTAIIPKSRLNFNVENVVPAELIYFYFNFQSTQYSGMQRFWHPKSFELSDKFYLGLRPELFC